MEGIRQGDIPGVQLRRRARIAGRTRDQVWPHLVEPVELSRWLADRCAFEPGPPPVLRFESDGPDGSDGAVRREYAEIVERARPQRLVWGFRELDAGWTSATVVTVELGPLDGDCEVMVFQEGFQRLPLSLGLTAWERSRSRWAAALERLVRLVGPDDPA